jgi:enterobactin synthetase component D
MTTAGGHDASRAAAHDEGHRLVPVIRELFPAGVTADASDFDERRPPPDVPLPPQVAASVAKRRAEFVAGRACARAALALAGCGATGEIAIGHLRAPIWPPGFAGSISHASGIAAAVAARTSHSLSLGLDLEAIVAPELAASLCGVVARGEELALVSRRTRGSTAAFTILFAAKEALFKCVAPLVGRYFDFLDAEVTSVEDDALAISLRSDLGSGYSAGRTVVVTFALLDGFVLAGARIPP